MTPDEIKAIPLGTDISGYSDEQIAFWAEVATQMIEDYTSRKFAV
jgi:hypothetical protein